VRRSGLALFALAFCTSAFAQPFVHSSGEYREYNRDWLAACPNYIDEEANTWYGYSCFASTSSQEMNSANHPVYKLTMVRNRLDGATDIAITVAAENFVYDQTRPILLTFSNAPTIALSFPLSLEIRDNTINQFFISDAEIAEDVPEHMKERAFLVLSVPLTGKVKPAETRLSTQGVLASLDFMSTHARKVAQY
jgi:hypothetical protein